MSSSLIGWSIYSSFVLHLSKKLRTHCFIKATCSLLLWGDCLIKTKNLSIMLFDFGWIIYIQISLLVFLASLNWNFFVMRRVTRNLWLQTRKVFRRNMKYFSITMKWVWFWQFNGISTFMSYQIPNPTL